MSVVELFPTEHEILAVSSEACEVCSKKFSNGSALRLHRVKSHRLISSEQDKRIYEKTSDGMGQIFIYHCPSEGCMRKEVKFDGMSNLKQHYVRVHTEKLLSCECGTRFALQKDLLYHKKARCSKRQIAVTNEPSTSCSPSPRLEKSIPSKKRKRKADQIVENAAKHGVVEYGKSPNPSVGVAQPIILVVPSENVAETIDSITRSLRSTCEVAVQAHGANEQYLTPQTNTIAVGEDPPQSFDFGGQFNSSTSLHPSNYYYSTPDVRHISTVTDCSISAGTNFFPYQPQDAQYNYQYDRQDCSTSAYPIDFGAAHPATATRSCATSDDQQLFEDVPMSRHAATSMELDVLRNIETQTSLEDLNLEEGFWRDLAACDH